MNTLVKLCAVSSLALVYAAANAQSYSITDLTAGSGFDATFAYGISQNGEITGTGSVPVSGELHAFIYQSGAFQDLGTLDYPYGADGVAINNSGQVAATGYGPGFNALLYSNGQATPIGNIDGGFSEGLSINNLGHIVGRAQNGDGGWQAFFYDGSFNILNTYIVRSINDSDQIAGSLGYYWTYGGYVHSVGHALLISNGVYTDLGSLGGGPRTYTEAYGINNFGDVTGYSTTANGDIHAFRYSAGTMTDLGTFVPYYTYGVSINDQGAVVGNIETYVGGQIGVFLYSNGTLINLADLLGPAAADWSQLTACQINDSGWIVGYGTHNGNSSGFLARPLSPGDLNCDGLVDFGDIDPFVLALSDAAGYVQQYPNCSILNGDINGDSQVNFTDIDPFVTLLSGGQ